MTNLKLLRKGGGVSIEVPADTTKLKINDPVSALANLDEVIQSLSGLESLILYVTDYGQTDSTKSLSFLRGAKRLKNLSICSMTLLQDCAALRECPMLESLSLTEYVIKTFDFSILPSLGSLRALSVQMPSAAMLGLISKATQLTSLQARRGFKLATLEPLTSLTKLQYLQLWSGSLASTHGLSAFENLTELNLGYSKIRDTAELGSLKRLTKLELLGNKTISNLDFLQEGNLEQLGLFKIPKLDSFKPILRCSRLKEIRCEAKVADDDLLPLTSHPSLEKATIPGRYKAALKKIRVDSKCVFKVGRETLKVTKNGPLVLETATEAKERLLRKLAGG